MRLSDLSGESTFDKVEKYLAKVANCAPLHDEQALLGGSSYLFLRKTAAKARKTNMATCSLTRHVSTRPIG